MNKFVFILLIALSNSALADTSIQISQPSVDFANVLLRPEVIDCFSKLTSQPSDKQITSANLIDSSDKKVYQFTVSANRSGLAYALPFGSGVVTIEYSNYQSKCSVEFKQSRAQ
ncbi:MAG: hypothetical protein ACXVCP_19740 [Bdellovibrio sp.]